MHYLLVISTKSCLKHFRYIHSDKILRRKTLINNNKCIYCWLLRLNVETISLHSESNFVRSNSFPNIEISYPMKFLVQFSSCLKQFQFTLRTVHFCTQ